MAILAELTTGWKAPPSEALWAPSLHQQAVDSGHYEETLRRVLAKQSEGASSVRLHGVDRTFRRSATGFGGVQKLVGALAALWSADPPCEELVCEIDAFAYAFLRSAKNYDLFLPVSAHDKAWIESLHGWKGAVAALEDFELRGINPASKYSDLKDTYLRLRRVIGRGSARDERRAVTSLLVSGPATGDEIKLDLGLNYPLSQRVLAALVETGALDRRDDGEVRYAVAEAALPAVLFPVREIMGLDLLAILEGMEREG